MRYYMHRARKKFKDGVRCEARQFHYIDMEMYLDKQPKWSCDTPGTFGPIEEDRKQGGVEGPETAVTSEGDYIKQVTEILHTEISNDTPSTDTPTPRPRE